MVCNSPDDEIFWFISRITNIRSHFGLILETYRGNLQSGKSIPRKIYIWSVEDNYRGPRKKQSQYIETRASEAFLNWNLAKFTCEQYAHAHDF